MDQESALVRVAENGRLSIPARQRKLLGLAEGGLVVSRVENGELRIRPVLEVLASLQARVRRHAAGAESSVDLLLAMRREEVAREDQEFEGGGSAT